MTPNEIEALLPEVLRSALTDDGPLRALVAVMSQLHAPVESLLGDIDTVFRPGATDDSFVPMLAQWAGMDRLLVPPLPADAVSTGNGRLRALLMRAAWLSQWRGTRVGLVAFLETACGVQGFEIDEQVIGPDGQPTPFHLRVQAPASMLAHRPLIERILEAEKPAYATCELVFQTPGEEPSR